MGEFTRQARTRNKTKKTTIVLDMKDFGGIIELPADIQAGVLKTLYDFVLHDVEPDINTIPGAIALTITSKIEADNEAWLQKVEEMSNRKKRDHQAGKYSRDLPKEDAETPETPFT